MLYNVSTLLKSPGGTDLRQPIEGTVALAESEAQLVSPVTGDVRFQRTNQGILASGTFTVTARLECGRCLEAFDLPMRVAFTEMYLPTIDILTGNPLPPVSEEDGFTIDARHHLDLSEAVRQQIILNLPSKPLCREDCQGLCAICGGNRNERPCDCEAREEARSGAFAALTDLLPTGD